VGNLYPCYPGKTVLATIFPPDCCFLPGGTELSEFNICVGFTCSLFIPDQRFESVPADNFSTMFFVKRRSALSLFFQVPSDTRLVFAG
jgi:hypothetical protein